MPVTVELPKQLGIYPTIAKEHHKAIADYMKWAFQESFYYNSNSAVLLAELSEIKPGEPVPNRNSTWSPNEWWWFKLKEKTGDLIPLHYWSYVPSEAAAEPWKKWPTILFLHGAGERRDPKDVQRLAASPGPDCR